MDPPLSSVCPLNYPQLFYVCPLRILQDLVINMFETIKIDYMKIILLDLLPPLLNE